jgi:hypothetical protein
MQVEVVLRGTERVNLLTGKPRGVRSGVRSSKIADGRENRSRSYRNFM